MSDYLTPEGSKFYGSQGDQTTFVMPGHTVGTPYLLIFDRKVPQSNGQGGTSNPSYRVRVIRGLKDAEDVPLETRAVVDINIRWPAKAVASDVVAMIAVAGEILSSVDFQDDVVNEQLLPREAATGD